MTQKFSLDDIKAAADKKYGSLIITLADGSDLELKNVLRLKKDKRDQVQALQARLAEEDDEEKDAEDQFEVLTDMLRAVATEPKLVDQFLNDIDNDLGVVATVFNEYVEGTQVGEASGSQS